MSNANRPRTVIDAVKAAQKANARRKRTREKRAAEIAARKPREGYEPCIVSFIDVLGFRDMLASRHADDIADVLNILRLSVSPVETKMKRRKGQKWWISQSFTDSVSDAVVRARVFDTEYHDGAFFHEILDLLHAQIHCILAGVFVRGGVTVGDAYVGKGGRGPIFGPAMVRAYEVESKQAKHPRIVIDDHAYNRFLTDRRLRSRDHSLKADTRYVNNLLAVDKMGVRFIDYLRGSAIEFDEPIYYYSFLSKHAELIREKLSTPDKRVYSKFKWLARYHNKVIGECKKSLKKHYSDHESEDIRINILNLLRGAHINIMNFSQER